MELRDLVLSTLEELDDRIAREDELKEKISALHEEDRKEEAAKQAQQQTDEEPEENKQIVIQRSDDELAFLKHTRERLQILFEGLKSSEIKDPEAKLEVTLKYLQLLLAQVDERVQEVKEPLQ